MGGGSWAPKDWATYSTTAKTRSVKETFTSTYLHKDLDPKGVVNRESRDSTNHPQSTAIGIFLDVTGSMGNIAKEIAATGLGTIVENIYDKKPVTDPQILVGAVGDSLCDKVPLQVSQFESDMTMVDQIRKIYVEGGGGGNTFESYALPLYFMAMHTDIDCFNKRGEKGFLFTIGDEGPELLVHKRSIAQFIGDEVQADLPLAELLTLVRRKYHYFHLLIEEGSHCRAFPVKTKADWVDQIGQNLILVSDYTKLGEIIVSTIQLIAGTPVEEVIKGWSGDTSIAVAHAVKGMTASGSNSASKGVTRF